MRSPSPSARRSPGLPARCGADLRLFADLGVRFLIQAFLAVMLGGIGTFEGPVAGGGVIGALSAALPWVIAPVLADVLVFVIAIVIVSSGPEASLGEGGFHRER